MAIHVAEEARHISFAHEFLRRRIPEMRPFRPVVLSLFYPLGFRVAASLITKPPRSFWREFEIPKAVRRRFSGGHRNPGRCCARSTATFGCSPKIPA